MNPLLMAFGASENTLPYASAYLRIYLLGTVFVQLVLGLNPFISAQGFAREAMFSVVIGAALNIALDPLFIFALGMGVRGAALATIISQGFSCLWVLRFLTGSSGRMRLCRANLRFDRAILARTVSLGVSPFTMTFTESAIQVVLNRGMMTYGGDMYVGTMTIISSVVHLFSTPLSGYTNGVQPLMSFNYGAGNLSRVKKTFRLLLLSTVTITMSCSRARSSACSRMTRRSSSSPCAACASTRQVWAFSDCRTPFRACSSVSGRRRCPCSSPCCARSSCSSRWRWCCRCFSA